MTSGLFEIRGVIRPYAWGSRTAIPDLLGVPPSDEPAAELWLGAHPDDPAGVPGHGTSLDKLIAADPQALLGADLVERFGPQLPFLLKVLAAETALSIQVHPDLAQARVGFAAEDARGIDRSSPQRNYKDPNHKPELLCALTPFDALCGFRPVAETLRLLDALGLASYHDRLARDGLRVVFTELVTSGDPALVADALPRLAGTRWATLGDVLARVAADFPGDRGLAVALLLNFVRLQPGEAIYLGAGNVHAYLRGMGVEIMANSDNVLRCGLTPKHVDVPELLRITDFRSLAEPRWPARQVSASERVFEVPVADFALSLLEVEGMSGLDADGPQILLCTSGEVQAGELTLRRGQAAFLAAGHAAQVSGTATVFRARPGGAAPRT